MPMRGELPAATTRTADGVSVGTSAWSLAIAVVSDQDLQAVVWIALIGILLTVNVMLRFPDFGQTFASLAVFS
jgi:hypothetical protein